MIKSREFFKQTLENIPRWMDTRKRPETSVSGRYIKSISDEQDDIYDEFERFKKEFFLVNYIGKELDVVSNINVAFVGQVDDLIITNSNLPITSDSKLFYSNYKEYILYQDGYLFIDPTNLDHTIMYTSNGHEYGAILKPYHIWNIFDEFAMFSSLERFPEESNAELLQRCLASFRHPTNSTEDGLKNAIINAVTNYVLISKDNIKIETPNQFNMYLIKDDKPLYDVLSEENKDLLRTKLWNLSYWENGFKDMEYIPNQWDAPVSSYQKGTGQLDDLSVKLSSELGDIESTDLYITGYKKSPYLINSYIRRQGIQKSIPLELKAYTNELKPQELEYKIIASDAQKISPDTVYISSLQAISGIAKHYLSNLILDSKNLTVTSQGELQPNTSYKLRIYPKDEHTDFKVYKAIYTNTKKQKTNLLETKPGFTYKNNILTNNNSKAFISRISDLKSYSGMTNTTNGFTLSKDVKRGEFAIDITGMGGSLVKLAVNAPTIDYTADSNIVKTSGFTLSDDVTLTSTSELTNTMTIEMDVVDFGFEFVPPEQLSSQGSIIVRYEVDGTVDATNSGIWSSPRKFFASYPTLRHVKVTITKSGAHPVSIKNIRASRYNLSMKTDRGTLLQTGSEIYLPVLSASEKNTLRFTLDPYSNYIPVINYIKIGSMNLSDMYESKTITTDAAGKCYLDIEGDCRVALYRVVNNNEYLVSPDYYTKPSYQNQTDKPITVPIDTSNFISIKNSSIPIESITYNGALTGAITVYPGEIIDNIQIEGESRTAKDKVSLQSLICDSIDDEVYIAGNANGFIVKHSDNTQEIRRIERNQLNAQSDIFTYEGLPTNTSVYFAIDNQITSINTTLDKEFESTFIMLNKSNSYIAYNKQTLIQSPLVVDLQQTFLPPLPANQLLFYTIENPINGQGNMHFIHDSGQKHTWQLGQTTGRIHIEYPFTSNNTISCEYELETLNEVFTLSNSMPLKNTYLVNGKEIELARYIITPPDDMTVNYKEVIAASTVTAENDGFNKLYHSNIIRIDAVTKKDGSEIKRSDYSLLGMPGVIVWSNKALAGQELTIVYTYKEPISLSYKNLDSLYEIAGYSTDAYKALNSTPIIVENMKDGETYTANFLEGTPDKIIVRPSNSGFQTTIDNNRITVHKISSENTVLVHPGYYYDNEKEYYFFESLYKDKADRFKHVELHYVEQLADTLRLMSEASNFFYNSIMNNGTRKETVCEIDCQKYFKRLDGYSRLNSITACDSYQLWNAFRMNVSLVPAYNNLGIRFLPKGIGAYAILDITNVVRANTIITFSASEGLTTYIAEEVKAHGDSMERSIYAEPTIEIKADKKTGYRTHIFTKTKKHKYYLLVTGTGIIDDIVVKDYDENEIISNIHKKPISQIGFSIQEYAQKDYEKELIFDPFTVKAKGLDTSKNELISIGTNVDWGVTKIADFRQEFNSFILDKVVIENEALVCKSASTGRIKTPAILVPNRQAVISVYAKVNDVLIKNLKNFTIQCYSAETKNSVFRKIAENKKTNLMEIQGNGIGNYLQFVVELDNDKVINSLEVYVRYAEIPDAPLYITQNERGNLISSVYDTTLTNSVQLHRFTGSVTHPEYVTFEIRGCRMDDTHIVWTQWYPYQITNDLHFVGNEHVFENYRYFQFRITLTNPEATLHINSIIFKVVV